jgi:carboxymethylenebutenolidase
MGNTSHIELKASDGHVLEAYRSAPSGKARGGIVIAQEIFGISGHIQRICDDYASEGYLAIAPAFFDRISKRLILDYKDIPRGIDAVTKLSEAMVLADLHAGVAAAAEAGSVAVIGYCWGGSVAYLGASMIAGVAAGVNYYGSRTVQMCERMKPHAPVMYHFGSLDKTLPPESIAKIKDAHPAGIYHVYPDADHGFNCDERAQYNPSAAKLARERTLQFLKTILRAAPALQNS